MKTATAKAIRTLLMLDRTVTTDERNAVLAAIDAAREPESLALLATDGATLTTTEVCRLLRLSLPTVLKLIKRGTLSGTKIGKQYRVSSESVRQFVAKIS